MKTTFPKPVTQLNVLKRYLHVLALLQKNDGEECWNAGNLAVLLSEDEDLDGGVEDFTIRKDIAKHLENELGLKVETKKGSRRTRLTGKLTDELYRQVARHYSNFVAHDDAKDMVLARLIKKHEDDALWLMARLYFAQKKKNVVNFEYRGNLKAKEKKYAVHPYHMVFRNNNLYLVGMNEDGGRIQLFILNKVNRLVVTDKRFGEQAPSIGEIFKDTLGSFRGKKYAVELHFDEALLPQIEEILSVLEPRIEPLGKGGRYKASFTVSDDLYLCKQLFMYGSRVEIMKPAELRATMLDLLEQGLAMYKK